MAKGHNWHYCHYLERWICTKCTWTLRNGWRDNNKWIVRLDNTLDESSPCVSRNLSQNIFWSNIRPVSDNMVFWIHTECRKNGITDPMDFGPDGNKIYRAAMTRKAKRETQT